MLFLQLFGLEIVVINLFILYTFARFPWPWKWRFQSFLGDVEQGAILFHVHAQVARILFNLLLSRLVILWQLLLHYFEALSNQSVSGS